ncbi:MULTISPECIES: ATP-binding protein [Paenibacillus]|uniref:ATP-binding protein n=2 Tax=Paenibacillus TaxID=44249 RepID=A0A5D0CLY4_9BACL|nr:MULTISPECIES: ATP-binding protein [Paenibacillus]PYI50073.1 ATP-binding protein [Paenibacillus flagellatus]TYA10550.1 ATP-binding protein [Paenibacillus faecis]
MKSGLIIKLIEAHCSGNEDAFKKALENLASDEERKGNSSLSNALMSAYSYDKKSNVSFNSSPLSEMSFSVQSALPTPKDKDSALELIEVLQPKVKLSDVALPEKTKEALLQIIEEQKQAEELLTKGVSPTNRILLCGPPGCGKTLTANAIAGEIDIPVAYVRLDGLVSSYLGQTGTNIRKIFEFVKNKRIVLFLDEFDAIAKKRDDAHELGELKRVVTTLLQNLDSMPVNVFLVAATNHHHLLDPAIWRRFDTSILLELPNAQQRESIITKFINETLELYEMDIKILTTLTEGMSGAQVGTFLQALAKYCIMQHKTKIVTKEDIANVWVKQSSLLISEDSDAYTRALYKLNKSGISMRTLEEITGISKSTLSYRFNKEEKSDE